MRRSAERARTDSTLIVTKPPRPPAEADEPAPAAPDHPSTPGATDHRPTRAADAHPRPTRADEADRQATRAADAHPRPTRAAEQAQPPADRHIAHRGLIFAIVSIALFMASVDTTIVATGLPAIQNELHAPINWSGWTITIYSLGQVIAMPVAGKLSDMYGRRTVFLVAAVLFTAISLCCGVAQNIDELVALRMLQALGGGAFMPSATGIVADHFGPARDRAVGMFTSILPIGGIVGPVLGGMLVAAWSWRAIFLVNVPVGLVLIALAAIFVPRGARRPTQRIDGYGVATLGILILAAMFGISYLGEGNVPLYHPVVLASEAVAACAAWLFVRHSRRHPTPFIPFQLLRGRGFGVMNLINLLYGAAAIGFAALVPLYAEERYGLPPLASGVLLTARAVGMISVAGLAVLALRRTGCRAPMVSGFLVITTGLVALAATPHLPPPVWLALAAAVTGCGMGLAVPASNNASLQLAPEHVAAIAGLRGMFRQSGAIIAVSLATAVIARSANAGMAQAHLFLGFAAALVAVLPLVLLVPDHRGSW